MNVSRLQVGIVPADLERSLMFYRDVLGMPYHGRLQVGDDRALHNFTVGDAILKLLEAPGTPAPGPDGGEMDDVTGFRWVTMDLEVGDIDAAVQRCQAAGSAVPMPVTQRRPGLRVAIVTDPDGNRVELVEREGG